MYQDSEVVNLVMCVVSFGIIGRFADRGYPRFRYFYRGLLFMSASFFATVAQGVMWHNLFNFIEALCSAISGLLFAFACFNPCRTGAAVQDDAVADEAEPRDVNWVKAR